MALAEYVPAVLARLRNSPGKSSFHTTPQAHALRLVMRCTARIAVSITASFAIADSQMHSIIQHRSLPKVRLARMVSLKREQDVASYSTTFSLTTSNTNTFNVERVKANPTRIGRIEPIKVCIK